jgi:hypothetical protein
MITLFQKLIFKIKSSNDQLPPNDANNWYHKIFITSDEYFNMPASDLLTLFVNLVRNLVYSEISLDIDFSNDLWT